MHKLGNLFVVDVASCIKNQLGSLIIFNGHDAFEDQTYVALEVQRTLLFHEQRMALCKMVDNRV